MSKKSGILSEEYIDWFDGIIYFLFIYLSVIDEYPFLTVQHFFAFMRQVFLLSHKLLV